jgi:hypothetical protein
LDVPMVGERARVRYTIYSHDARRLRVQAQDIRRNTAAEVDPIAAPHDVAFRRLERAWYRGCLSPRHAFF